MVEARDKLIEICQLMVVTADVGLNKSIDQRLGIRPPEMSIAERKIEKPKKFVAQSGANSSPMSQVENGATSVVNRITLHTLHKSPALGGFQAALPSVVHVPPSLASPASVSRGSVSTSSGLDSSCLHLPQKEGSPLRSVHQPHVQVQSASVSRVSVGTSSGLHTVHQSPAVKPSPAHSVGGFQAAPSVVHVPFQVSPVSLNQLHVNAVQSASVSSALIGTSSGPGPSSSQLPQYEGAPFRSDGRLNGPIYPSHVQGMHATLSPQSLGITKVGQGNRALNDTCNVDGTTEVTYKVVVQVITDQDTKPYVQSVHEKVTMHQPSQVSNCQQPSSVFSHRGDIGKNVQKISHDTTVHLTKRKLGQRQRRERERAERETVKAVEPIDKDRRARERAEKERK